MPPLGVFYSHFSFNFNVDPMKWLLLSHLRAESAEAYLTC